MKESNEEIQSHSEVKFLSLSVTFPGDLERERTRKEILRIVKNDLSLSETKSLYSHLTFGMLNFKLVGFKNLSAREALGLAIIIPTIKTDLKFLIRIELSEICHLKKYEGMWHLVHKILELDELEDIVFVLHELENIKGRAIFGNYIPQGLERFKKLRLIDPKQQKPNYPNRKRGYNDHGSRREDHKWLPKDIFLGSNPSRKDLRDHLTMYRKIKLWVEMKIFNRSKQRQAIQKEKLDEEQTTKNPNGANRR